MLISIYLLPQRGFNGLEGLKTMAHNERWNKKLRNKQNLDIRIHIVP